MEVRVYYNKVREMNITIVQKRQQKCRDKKVVWFRWNHHDDDIGRSMAELVDHVSTLAQCAKTIAQNGTGRRR